VIAFDLGTRSTGVAWADDSDTFECPPDINGGPRLDWWHRTFRMALLPFVGGHAAVESPFFHPKHPSGAVPLIELHGVFRLAAHDAEMAVHTVAPTELKKHATGRGNATKDDMLAHARWLRPTTDFASHDEADAVCLWHLMTDRGVT
jgi:Holliday junction resolvasome RuvABC endonuclease subunit